MRLIKSFLLFLLSFIGISYLAGSPEPVKEIKIKRPPKVCYLPNPPVIALDARGYNSSSVEVKDFDQTKVVWEYRRVGEKNFRRLPMPKFLPKEPGNFEIHAKYTKEQVIESALVTIEVRQIESLCLEPKEVLLLPQEKILFKVTGKDNASRLLNIADVKEQLEWTFIPENIASIANGEVIAGDDGGRCQLTVAIKNAPHISSRAEIKILPDVQMQICTLGGKPVKEKKIAVYTGEKLELCCLFSKADKGFLGFDPQNLDLHWEVEPQVAHCVKSKQQGNIFFLIASQKPELPFPVTVSIPIAAQRDNFKATIWVEVKRPPVEKVEIAVIPRQDSYVTGEPITLRIAAFSQEKNLPDVQFTWKASAGQEPPAEAGLGLYDWTPTRAGTTVLIAREKDSLKDCQIELDIKAGDKTTPPKTQQDIKRWLNRTKALLGSPRKEHCLALAAELNKTSFAQEDEVKIFYSPQQDGFIYILNIMPEKVQMILPLVGYLENQVTAESRYCYPFSASTFPFEKLEIGETDELYLLLLSQERIGVLDNLLALATQNAKEKQEKHQEFDLFIPMNLETLQSVGEELLGGSWGYQVLTAKLR